MIIIAKVNAINTSDGVYNVAVKDKENNYNVKVNPALGYTFVIGQVYEFDVTKVEGTERISYNLNSAKHVNEFDIEKKESTLRDFFPAAPIDSKDAKPEVYKYIDKIENKIIKAITNKLIKENEDEFFIYPAASKMHHAYVGGLAYHSIGMLHFADGFIENYPYLNKDYIYAGILLHDIGKTIELSGAVNTEYSLKGQLLGHLVLGAMQIEAAAKELGYEDSEEALILEHMLVSHHGQPMFGSAKKPMTAEALVLWYIDTIDSKFRVLGEELAKTPDKEFTDSIGVLDRTKIYKV
jgi:3'-5' exoribonuclease